MSENLCVCVYLAVSDVGVSECVGGEDPAQGGDAHLVLEGGVLGQGAVQVPLDLLGCQVVFAHRLFHQVFVVPGVGGHLVDRPYQKTHAQICSYTCNGNSP